MDLLNIPEKSNEEKMIRKYSHYQGYKWGLIFLGVASIVIASFEDYRMGGNESPVANGLFMFLCFVGAYVFDEKMKHSKTIQKYRSKLKDLRNAQQVAEKDAASRRPLA